MKKRNITLFTAIAAAVAFAPTAQAAAITAPTDGYVGLYRLAFVTSENIDPEVLNPRSETDITAYDTYVTTVGDGVAELLALNTDWQVLGSTVLVNIRVHTDTEATDATNIRVYTLDGVKIADNYVDFFDGSWDTAFTFEDGSINDIPTAGLNDNRFYTGTNNDGTTATGGTSGALGNSRGVGVSYNTAGDVDRYQTGLGTETWRRDERHTYKLSGDGLAAISTEVFQVPEPSTFTLLGLAGLALIFRRRS